MAALGLRCSIGFSLVVAGGGYSLLQYTGFSLQWLLLIFGSTGCRVQNQWLWHMACGISPDQGSNLYPLHWQEDFYPLYHQGSPPRLFFFFFTICTLIILLTTPYSIWDLSSLIRDQTCASCSGNMGFLATGLPGKSLPMEF